MKSTLRRALLPLSSLALLVACETTDGSAVFSPTPALGSSGMSSGAGATSQVSGAGATSVGGTGGAAGSVVSGAGTASVGGAAATGSGGGATSMAGSATTGGMGGTGAGGTMAGGGAGATPVAGAAGASGAGGQGSVTGARFPFPQNVALPNCVFPGNYSNHDVQAAYDLWKETVVTSDGAGAGNLRVRKPDSGSVIGSTVSEGIGYGMLLAVYLDDPAVFDGLWKYTLQYLNGNGLMDWEVDPNGSVIGTGAALDGDEDMAWALIMADRQWGGGGTLERSYLEYAVDLVEAMWDHEIDHSREEMPLPGDSWGGRDVTNISYYAPAYYRVFGEITDNVAGWNQAIDTSYDVLERSLNAASGNESNGLVPAWCNFAGQPVEAYDGAPLHFQNDSTRTPFRIGQDYCYYGEPRALAYLQKITSFYVSVGVANIIDGYELNGTPRPEHSMNGLGSASFTGPAGVGASYSADNQTFLDEAYAAVATGQLTAGTIYYQKSWAALSLLMMTGGFYEFPAR